LTDFPDGLFPKQKQYMQRINFLDIKEQYLQIKDEARAAIDRVIEETAFSGGPFVAAFEEKFAQWTGSNHAVGVANGTIALQLAFTTLNIGPGDEVIVPANTFIATAWGVSHVGATPVFVDCTADTWEIDPAKIEEKITPRTKAIAGVHLYGQTFDIRAVKAIADKHNLYLVEDCAQAHGARYEGQHVGNTGEMGCFSFYPGKNLGTFGEGGGVITNSQAWYDRMTSLRNHGSKVRYYHDEIGYNWRMGGIEGAILEVKLKYIDAWNQRRKDIAARYKNEISNAAVTFQVLPEWADSVYHLFVITVPDRDHFMAYMNEHNIYPGLHYPVPCHLQKAYQHLGYTEGALPNSEYLAAHCVSLPMYAELKDEAVDYIIETINAYK
jgi:dTDP-4-amino-4,6-dideoxygalactose transaminase